ncbi:MULTISPECIES: HK97-gp10 family putative phage morphogenesis protein [Lacticaseibacillus]|uniref:HK97-gp10 family putative phage morphogenesis protein n=1 Tax=Lacticaseibacillus yichunensis TaxID=2486015 RepID=A0ABW4CNB3_9LACO|nr:MULTISPECIES: HK97-gp10 family putative phage morphogenesis protein [Lacticaseibacillus]
MSVKTTGIDELQAKLLALDLGIQANARKAVKDGAEVFAKALSENTPEYTDGPGADAVHLADHVALGAVTDKTGDISVDVGYDKETGGYAHFPNSGTSKQSPQHFIEATEEKTRDAVIAAMLKHLEV